MLFKLTILKKRSLGIFSFVLFVAVLLGISSNLQVLYADGEKVHGKTIRLIKGRIATEIIKAKDSNGIAMPNANISVTVDEPAIASIKIKDVGAGDKLDDNGTIAVAVADGGGSKAFIVKGLREGKTTVNFTITGSGDGAEVVKHALTVKVIELKIKDNSSW